MNVSCTSTSKPLIDFKQTATIKVSEAAVRTDNGNHKMWILLGGLTVFILLIVVASIGFASRDYEGDDDHKKKDFLDRDDPFGKDD